MRFAEIYFVFFLNRENFLTIEEIQNYKQFGYITFLGAIKKTTTLYCCRLPRFKFSHDFAEIRHSRKCCSQKLYGFFQVSLSPSPSVSPIVIPNELGELGEF